MKKLIPVLNKYLKDDVSRIPLSLHQTEEDKFNEPINNKTIKSLRDIIYNTLSDEYINILAILQNKPFEQKIALDLINSRILNQEIDYKNERVLLKKVLKEKGYNPTGAVKRYISTLSIIDPTLDLSQDNKD